jgi:preprotein translocase subunit SecF
LLIFSGIYLVSFYNNNGDFIRKDISLTGGTSITVYDSIPIQKLTEDLSQNLTDLNVRGIYELSTGAQKAFIIETTIEGDKTKEILENYLNYSLTFGENADFEYTESTLGSSFYKQLLIAILIAFFAMALVVFLIFKTFVPSTAVLISAIADIVMTLVTFNLLGLKMSTAGIIAFLMLIGYSVDTDILLTTRILKRKDGSINSRIKGAMQTGLTMTLTSLFAFLAAFFVVKSFSQILAQIFTILTLGLTFDLLNTWVTNVSILKWYAQSKK